jgi:hypothetical protein
MDEPVFTLNHDAEARGIAVGHEKTPALIIDDLASNFLQLHSHARDRVEFQPAVRNYPGMRAPLPTHYLEGLARATSPLLKQMHSIPAHFRLIVKAAFYSFVALDEAELKIGQRIPHVDHNRPFGFAVMQYLSPASHGGTGFFRHIPTGFETIPQERDAEYRRALDEYHAQHGPPPQSYVGGSSGQYEQIARIAYRPNRLVAYPGMLLHSGLIDPEVDLSQSTDGARMTANVFMDFEP